jgi:hypothetical protein
MKIEVIRKESKPVEIEVVPGGIYRQTLDEKEIYYVIAVNGKGYRFVGLSDGALDYGDSTEDEIKHTLRFCRMVYVPNARLVIEE